MHFLVPSSLGRPTKWLWILDVLKPGFGICWFVLFVRFAMSAVPMSVFPFFLLRRRSCYAFKEESPYLTSASHVEFFAFRYLEYALV